jgi:hypothetical protein
MLFNGYVNGTGSTQAWNSLDVGIKLAAGDTIDAIVGNGHNGNASHSTGVDLIIRNVEFPH